MVDCFSAEDLLKCLAVGNDAVAATVFMPGFVLAFGVDLVLLGVSFVDLSSSLVDTLFAIGLGSLGRWCFVEYLAVAFRLWFHHCLRDRLLMLSCQFVLPYTSLRKSSCCGMFTRVRCTGHSICFFRAWQGMALMCFHHL